jgi:hypothetical protein
MLMEAAMHDVLDPMAEWTRVTDTQWASRTSQTFARYFSGLEIVEPGLVTMGLWRPGPGVPIPPYPIPAYCGVARKP